MGQQYETIDDALVAWIVRQHVFFVATAPGEGGHVNCSPKGLDSFRVLGPTTVAYLDFSGSGIETIAHLRDNGRIVLMFCAFEGPPRIVRLHGHGTPISVDDGRFGALLGHFEPLRPELAASARAVICIEVDRISDSCGFGVPLMRYQSDRSQIGDWTDNRVRTQGPDAIEHYRQRKNSTSIDGLPGWVPAES